ncbi:MAG TPA: hypothetical protein DCO83_03675 [Mucilaginibacter sp.]|nr:hypothetical protein [Mucilaginibacter sp.]
MHYWLKEAVNLFGKAGEEKIWIRFGHFSDPKQFKPAADADKHWALFPIPTEAHQKDPNLVQNPGYTW